MPSEIGDCSIVNDFDIDKCFNPWKRLQEELLSPTRTYIAVAKTVGRLQVRILHSLLDPIMGMNEVLAR